MQETRKLTPFGKAIKKRLVDLDMNQKDLARKIGTSAPQITYILYGSRSVERWVDPICEALGLNAGRYGGTRKGA